MPMTAVKKRINNVLKSRACDRIVAVLILVSAGLLFAEIAYPENEWLPILGNLVLWLFAVELSLRFYSEPSKKAFFRSYWVDILALAPLLGTDRALTALRLLRLLRLGPLLMRVNNRLATLVRQTLGEQVFILNMIFVFVLGVALGLVAVEGDNPEFDSPQKTIWWALFSMIAGEPIGDMPESFAGRILTLAIMLGGLTVFALFTGTVSAVMADKLRNSGRGTMITTEDLKGHIILCGWNRSGRVLLEELRHSPDTADLAIAIIAEKRPDLSHDQEIDPLILFVEGDYTNAEILKEAGVARATRAILLADKSNPQRNDQDRDARTILASLILEKLNPHIFICAELLSRENEPHLQMAGVQEIIVADEYSATILAASTRVRGVTEIVDEILSVQYGNQFYKVIAPAKWEGMEFVDVQTELKKKHDALVLGIEKPPADPKARQSDKEVHARTLTNPPSDYKIHAGDRLIVISKKEPKW